MFEKINKVMDSKSVLFIAVIMLLVGIPLAFIEPYIALGNILIALSALLSTFSWANSPTTVGYALWGGFCMITLLNAGVVLSAATITAAAVATPVIWLITSITAGYLLHKNKRE